MEDRERVDLLESNLARQLHWIASADRRVVFVFTLCTAMLGLLAAIAAKNTSSWSVAAVTFTFLAAGLGFLGLLFVSFASFPRTEGPERSLIYFGGITQCNAGEFHEAIKRLTIDEYVSDLAAQCHRNAEIATQKFTWIQRALFCLYVSLPFWVLALWVHYNAAC